MSVIITTYNSAEFITECLDAVLSQNYKPYEVILTDGGSTDGSTEILTKYPIYYEINDTLKSPASGRNRAVELSSGEILVLIDSDCVPIGNDWINNLVKYLSKDVKSVGGPNITHPKGNLFSRGAGLLFSSTLGGFKARNPANYENLTEVDHNPPCNAAIPKNIFEEVGGYNEKLKMAEDIEFDYRLKKFGHKLLFNPKARVYHKRRDNLYKFIKQVYGYGFWRAKVGKTNELIKIWHVLPSLGIILIFSLVLGSIYILVIRTLIIYLIIIYFMICLFFLVKTYVVSKDIASFILPILAPIEHISYGIGFIVGWIKK